MSLELQVTPETPPTFLWHTAEDGSVPVENSLLFAAALHKHGVPFELHVYPHGRHGLGLAPEDPHVATWADLCCEWLKRDS
jgi:dipeptidyl aminopeptidase/acylaminoacyl peptidase